METNEIGKRELNPWIPEQDVISQKYLGKLLEELGELTSATARCLIQGIGEKHPTTEKPNKLWLEDELSDVAALSMLVSEHFNLDQLHIKDRIAAKYDLLKGWLDKEVV